MSDSLNALVAQTGVNLPSTQLGSDDDFSSLTQSSEFLGRLQLYTKGNAINRKLIGPGEYGVPVSKDEIIGLGEKVDILPLARRPKAVDMSDNEAIITNYDSNSDEFKRIAAKSGEKESNCMYGISFLVLERTTGRFLEFFCGTKSSRPEAGKIFPFLPKFQGDCDAIRAACEAKGVAPKEEDVTPRAPRPVTMTVKLVEKGTWSWHVPVVLPCSTEFKNLPPAEKIMEEISKFLAAKDDGIEVADEPEKKSGRRAR